MELRPLDLFFTFTFSSMGIVANIYFILYFASYHPNFALWCWIVASCLPTCNCAFMQNAEMCMCEAVARLINLALFFLFF